MSAVWPSDLGEPMARFNNKYVPGSSIQCWVWTGSKNARGYGLFRLAGRTRSVHRLAYEMAFGAITGGLHVLHKCDNRACINPSHLFLGTNADNVADRCRKGRTNHAGERNSKSKLTAAEVFAIREASGMHAEIAARYGVSTSTISWIKCRRSWRHL